MAAATCAGHDRLVWNTAPLDTPWVSESPRTTKGLDGVAGGGGVPATGAPSATPRVGTVMGGGATSVTITSGGVSGSRYSAGKSLVMVPPACASGGSLAADVTHRPPFRVGSRRAPDCGDGSARPARDRGDGRPVVGSPRVGRDHASRSPAVCPRRRR